VARPSLLPQPALYQLPVEYIPGYASAMAGRYLAIEAMASSGGACHGDLRVPLHHARFAARLSPDRPADQPAWHLSVGGVDRNVVFFGLIAYRLRRESSGQRKLRSGPPL
jgi:hypothetical protein